MSFNLVPKEAFDLLIEIYKDVGKPPAGKIGETLEDVLSLVFLPFNCLGMTVEQLKENYRNFLTNSLKKVEPEKLQLPPPNIAGKIFEGLKHRFTEPEIVEMFSKLLAGSMDSDKCDRVHPSFVEIINQMAVNDASNLVLFKKHKRFPVVHYQYTYELGSENALTNVFLANEEFGNCVQQSISISALERLGLIKIYEDTRFFNTINYNYERFYKTDKYLELLQEAEMSEKILKISVYETIAEITSLGINFVNICLPDTV